LAKEVFKAKVNWKKGFVCTADARGFQLTMDEPTYLGGTDLAMNPVEVLLSALGGCLTISAAAFAPACNVRLLDFSVEVEGDLDLDGFLGKNPEVRKGFSHIRYRMYIKSDAPAGSVEKLVKMIEKNCPVSDTLKGVSISGDYQLEGVE
jgi:uncharacterized OsmC-like protein